jgi:hypothetical protein
MESAPLEPPLSVVFSANTGDKGDVETPAFPNRRIL